MQIEFEHMPQYLIFKGYKSDNYYHSIDTETIIKMENVVCINRVGSEISITLDTHAQQPAVYTFELAEKSAIEIMELFKQYLKDYYPKKEK